MFSVEPRVFVLTLKFGFRIYANGLGAVPFELYLQLVGTVQERTGYNLAEHFLLCGKGRTKSVCIAGFPCLFSTCRLFLTLFPYGLYKYSQQA